MQKNIYSKPPLKENCLNMKLTHIKALFWMPYQEKIKNDILNNFQR
jgi:hypothetical protein